MNTVRELDDPYLVRISASARDDADYALELPAIRSLVEGGGHVQSFQFTTRSSHSRLHEALVLEGSKRKPVNAFFLRAESFFNFATAAEERPIEQLYGRPLHEQSHG